jgi:putative PIN family toxin of toxin-antitoxin system
MRSDVRLVLDTNTAVSGLLWPGGPPGHVIDAALDGRIELFSSTALLAELQGVLDRPKFARTLVKRGTSARTLFNGYAALVTHVSPAAAPRVVERDPDDDHVLACALAASARLIVSGDLDLLDLGEHQGVPILTAAQALSWIEQAPN